MSRARPATALIQKALKVSINSAVTNFNALFTIGSTSLQKYLTTVVKTFNNGLNKEIKNNALSINAVLVSKIQPCTPASADLNAL